MIALFPIAIPLAILPGVLAIQGVDSFFGPDPVQEYEKLPDQHADFSPTLGQNLSVEPSAPIYTEAYLVTEGPSTNKFSI